MKPNFNIYEKRILRILYNYKIPLTAYELSKETGASYQTMRKYANKLVKLNLLRSIKNEYKFNFNLKDKFYKPKIYS